MYAIVFIFLSCRARGNEGIHSSDIFFYNINFFIIKRFRHWYLTVCLNFAFRIINATPPTPFGFQITFGAHIYLQKSDERVIWGLRGDNAKMAKDERGKVLTLIRKAAIFHRRGSVNGRKSRGPDTILDSSRLARLYIFECVNTR